MSDDKRHRATPWRQLGSLAISTYVLGFAAAAAYFNWTYARDNGFAKWLVLGGVVATAKATVWPYFVIGRVTSGTNRSDSELPRSVHNYFFALDALARANSDDQVGSPPDPTRVLTLLQEAVDSAVSIDRQELNHLYPGLGDHFLDDGIGTAQLYLDAVRDGDRNRITRGMAAWLRWTNWYNANAFHVVDALRREYHLEVR